MEERRVNQKVSRGRWQLPVFIAVGAIVAIVALAIIIDSALYYNKVHAGVSVQGSNLSGLNREEATAKLDTIANQSLQSGIVLTHDDRSWTIMPDDVGVKMDVQGAVTAAMDASRKGNMITNLGRRLKLYFRGVDLPLNGTVDRGKLDGAVADIARDIDVAPVNAGLEIQGSQIRVIEDRTGLGVDQATLSQQLADILVTLHSTSTEIPTTVLQPAVTAADNSEAQRLAETMISAPIVVKDGDQSWSIPISEIAGYMDFKSEMKKGVPTLVPYMSSEAMNSFFNQIQDKVAKEPVSATFDSDGKSAWVVPAVRGQALNREKTAEAISAASLESSGRVAQVGLDITEPKLTTEAAKARGIKDLLASYTTPPYAGSSNRQVNVRITTQYASNVMLAPGDVYDFDKQIGPRTAARGYKTAPGIVGPGKLEDVFGGGICQVSTTLFNAVFFAGLKVVERHNHSIYIDHYPKGRDATVTAGGKNLRFKNDTSHWIWIRGASDGVTTTFNIYGTSEGRKVTYSVSDWQNVIGRSTVTIPNPKLGVGTTNVLTSGQSGKQLTTVRVVKLPDGTVLHKDTFMSYFPMVPMQVEVGTGTTTTTTVPSSSTSTTKPPPSSTTPTTAAPPPTS